MKKRTADPKKLLRLTKKVSRLLNADSRIVVDWQGRVALYRDRCRVVSWESYEELLLDDGNATTLFRMASSIRFVSNCLRRETSAQIKELAAIGPQTVEELDLYLDLYFGKCRGMPERFAYCRRMTESEFWKIFE